MTTTRGTVRKIYLSEDDATVCRECGQRFRMLGRHVRSHGMTPRGYKLRYGLPLSVGLVCTETFTAFSDSKIALHARDPLLLAKMQAANPPGREHLCGRGRIAEGALQGDMAMRAKGYRERVSRDSGALWESRRVEVLALWASGASYKEICAKFSCGVDALRNHLRQWEAPKRRMVFISG